MEPFFPVESFEKLRAESQCLLTQFLRTEIEIGFTFADSASMHRDHGDFDHSHRAREESARAIFTVHHFLNRIADPKVHAEIAERCARLQTTLAAV